MMKCAHGFCDEQAMEDDILCIKCDKLLADAWAEQQTEHQMELK